MRASVAHANSLRPRMPPPRAACSAPTTEMESLMKKLGSSFQSAISDWLVLNSNELTWIALLIGLVLFIGVFVYP